MVGAIIHYALFQPVMCSEGVTNYSPYSIIRLLQRFLHLFFSSVVEPAEYSHQQSRGTVDADALDGS